MRKISATILFKLRIILCDRVLLISMLIFPVVFSLISGYAVRDEAAGILRIAVTDMDNSSASNKLIQRVSARTGIRAEVTVMDEALEMMRLRKVEAVFIIPEGFERMIAEGSTESLLEFSVLPSSYSGNYLLEVFSGQTAILITRELSIRKCIDTFRAYGKDTKSLRERAGRYYDSYWDEKPLLQTLYTRTGGGEEIEETGTVLPASRTVSIGMLLVFLMFYILAGSGWLLDEKEHGTLKRLRSTPGALAYSYWGGTAALVLTGMLQAAVIVFLYWLVSGKTLFSGLLQYILLALYIFTSAGLSMFFSSVFTTRSRLQAFVPVFSLSTGFAGGCFWYFPELPDRFAEIASFTPQGWVLEGLHRLNLNNPAAYASVPFIVLALTASILPVISYRIVVADNEKFINHQC